MHGSAPDIAGKDIANPLALLLAVGLMLKHIDQPGLVNHLRATIDLVLRKHGVRTPDLGGKASTGDFPKASFVGWAGWERRNLLRDQYLWLRVVRNFAQISGFQSGIWDPV